MTSSSNNEGQPSSAAATLAAIASFSTCELSDALIKLGVNHGGYIPDINLLSSDDRDRRISGPAYTVQFIDTERYTREELPVLPGHFVDLVPGPGMVIVIDVPRPQDGSIDLRNAVWGGLMTAGAQQREAVGVVISGRCRDLNEHRSADFPVFARGHSTLGQSPFSKPSAVQVPLRVESGPDWPSVVVNPGDWIVGDVDGVVCVPMEHVNACVALARKGKEADARCFEDINRGNGIGETFKRWKGK